MSNFQIEALANAHCECGENPFWDADRKLVYWTDIPNGRLYRLDVATGAWEKFYDGPTVGGFTLQSDGNLLLFRDNEFCTLSPDGETKTLCHQVDETTGRFNDVFADPEGRVFAGTMSKADDHAGADMSGGLYRIDHDGSATRVFQGTGCSNGMGFTPDLKGMYWTDSSARVIFLYDYDRTTGELTNKRPWLTPEESFGIPDGMTVDAEGCVWSAFWDGFALRRFSPAGELLTTVDFPVGQVSSAVFGGDDYRDLYVTTAGGKDGSDTADGTLYRVRVDVPGRPEYHSRIGL